MLCLGLGHRHSDRVWYDGLEFRSACRRCGRPLIKDVVRGWRPFRPEDADPARLGKDEALAARAERGDWRHHRR